MYNFKLFSTVLRKEYEEIEGLVLLLMSWQYSLYDISWKVMMLPSVRCTCIAGAMSVSMVTLNLLRTTDSDSMLANDSSFSHTEMSSVV